MSQRDRFPWTVCVDDFCLEVGVTGDPYLCALAFYRCGEVH